MPVKNNQATTDTIIRVVHQRPLETKKDYEEMYIYISQIIEQAKNDEKKRIEYLHRTGKYTKEGYVKKEIANV